MNNYYKNMDLTLLIFRIGILVLFLPHGIAKLHSMNFVYAVLEAKGLPSMMAYGVYFGEIIAPILIFIGLFTRISSIAIIVTMAMAIYLADVPLLKLNNYGGIEAELQLLFALTTVITLLNGAGKYSLRPLLTRNIARL